MLADNLGAYPKSQSCAGGLFGGVEGLKDVGEGFLGDAAATVANGDEYAGAIGVFGRVSLADSNGELAAVGQHRIRGVRDEIGKELAKFSGEAEQLGIRFVVAQHSNGHGEEPALMECQHGVHQLANVCRSRQGGLPVEAQGLLRDF